MIQLLLFPVAAMALTFLVLMPFLSVFSLLYLKWQRRHQAWQSYATSSTYTAIVAPTILSLCWLGSAAVHESESMQFVQNCLVEHSSTHCVDSLMIFLMILAALIWVVLSRLDFITARHTLAPFNVVSESSDEFLMIERLKRQTPSLRRMKVVVVNDAPFAAMTFGAVPKIYVSRAFIEQSDTEVILATLLHEASHVRGKDPLRYMIADLLLQLNPVGWLLRREFWLWQDAREAKCDHTAVTEGADAMALAHGVVKAIKFERQSTQNYSAKLLGHTPHHLKLRIALLMGGLGNQTTKRPVGIVAFGFLLILSVCLPHKVTMLSLWPVHHFVESQLIP